MDELGLKSKIDTKLAQKLLPVLYRFVTFCNGGCWTSHHDGKLRSRTKPAHPRRRAGYFPAAAHGLPPPARPSVRPARATGVALKRPAGRRVHVAKCRHRPWRFSGPPHACRPCAFHIVPIRTAAPLPVAVHLFIAVVVNDSACYRARVSVVGARDGHNTK